MSTLFKLSVPNKPDFFGDRFEVKQRIWSLLATDGTLDINDFVLKSSLSRGRYTTEADTLRDILTECAQLARI
jgi:hypothetical protein